MDKRSRERILGLDLVRLLSIIPTFMYHFEHAVWDHYEEHFYHTMSQEPLFWNGIYRFMRAFSFSGMSILLLTMFLMGLNAKRERISWLLIILLPIGWAFFCWADEGFGQLFLYWDIYPLIAVGLFLIQSLFRFTKIRALYLAILGFIIMCIPFWDIQYFYTLSLFKQMVLVGNCGADLASWPLLPWVGLMLLGYAGGQTLKPILWVEQESGKKFIGLPWRKFENYVWPAILIPSVFWWGGYYAVNDFKFDCQMFRYPLIEFWAHMIWIVFLMRLSLLQKANAYLREKAAWVGELVTSRNFGVIYFYSFILGYIIAFPARHLMHENPLVFSLLTLLYWPLVEFSARIWVGYLPGRRR